MHFLPDHLLLELYLGRSYTVELRFSVEWVYFLEVLVHKLIRCCFLLRALFLAATIVWNHFSLFVWTWSQTDFLQRHIEIVVLTESESAVVVQNLVI